MLTLAELIKVLETVARDIPAPDVYIDAWIDRGLQGAMGIQEVITDSEGVHLILED